MVRQEECALYRMPVMVKIAGRSLVRRDLGYVIIVWWFAFLGQWLIIHSQV